MKTILAIVLSLVPVLAHAEDKGFFNCMHLSKEQKDWFATPGVSECCNLADGMPVRFEERPTGTFIPPFEKAYFEAAACRDSVSFQFGSPVPPLKDGQEEDRSSWIRIDSTRMLKKSNPIGIGIVWWTNAGYPSTEEHTARCFLGLDKV
jgi:hypothetical protein